MITESPSHQSPSFYVSYHTLKKSPHTLRAYANHLKLYWEFLQFRQYDWQTVTIDDFAQFVYWLRSTHVNVAAIGDDGTHTKRTASTVNTILTALSSFYRYQKQLGNSHVTLTQLLDGPANRHRSLLYHIFKHAPVKRKLIKLKQIKPVPATLTDTQLQILLNACHNARDSFLVALLIESGMRIGQTLNLKHQDIKSWDNEIHIIPRSKSRADARCKLNRSHVVHVTPELMRYYTTYWETYCIEATPSDMVFMNLSNNQPLTYRNVRHIFAYLSDKIGHHVTAHMLRHTHATQLLQAGWEAAYVQRRLGHAHVQTTIDTYAHLSLRDIKTAFQAYANQRKGGAK